MRVLAPGRAGLVSARPGVVSASPSGVSGVESEAPRASATGAAETEATGEAPRTGQARGHSAALSPSAEAVESAAMLFEKANVARRAGDPASAVMLYRRLQRGFPSSADHRANRWGYYQHAVDARRKLRRSGARGPDRTAERTSSTPARPFPCPTGCCGPAFRQSRCCGRSRDRHPVVGEREADRPTALPKRKKLPPIGGSL